MRGQLCSANHFIAHAGSEAANSISFCRSHAFPIDALTRHPADFCAPADASDASDPTRAESAPQDAWRSQVFIAIEFERDACPAAPSPDETREARQHQSYFRNADDERKA